MARVPAHTPSWGTLLTDSKEERPSATHPLSTTVSPRQRHLSSEMVRIELKMGDQTIKMPIPSEDGLRLVDIGKCTLIPIEVLY